MADGRHIERFLVRRIVAQGCFEIDQCIVEALRDDLVLDRLQVWDLATCLHESVPQQKTAPRSGGAVPMVRPTASVQKWKLARTPTVIGCI